MHSPVFKISLIPLLLCACGPSSGSSSGPPSTGGGTDNDFDGLSNQLETSIGSDPNKADSDADGFPDGFEYFLMGAVAPNHPNVATILKAKALLPDGSAFADASATLWNPALDQLLEPALTDARLNYSTTTNVNGVAKFKSIPWPTAGHQGTKLTVSGAHDGSLNSGSMELPPLTSGEVLLPDLVTEVQPYMRGTDFFVAMPYVGKASDTTIVMAFMNPGDELAEVQWSIPGAPTTVPFSNGVVQVPPGDSRVTSLPSEYLLDRVEWGYTIEMLNLGVSVQSSNPISVSVQLSNSREGMAVFSCLPSSSQGTDYFLKTLPSGGIGSGREVGAISMISCAGADSTARLNFDHLMSYDQNGVDFEFPPGVGFDLPITKGSSLQVVLNEGTFSGARCVSTTPVGVVGGSTDSDYDVIGNAGGRNLMVETTAPTNHWGSSFTTFGSIGDRDSRIFVQAGANTTYLVIGGGSPIQLAPGEEYGFYLSQNGATTIASDQPILVWQLFGWFNSSGTWGNSGGACLNLAPQSRWSTEEVLWAYSETNMSSYMSVLVPTSSLNELRIDGQRVITMLELVEPPITVNSELSLVIVRMTAGSHHVTSPEPAFPMMYGRIDAGTGGFAAYAYSQVW
jgi:hypothetical protein